ncbi:MAG: hypothetical protein KDA84_07690 [Planctomycetaceae bacterium]|nr:hypothetical protein [Planctomycetaceae bacterium]
MSEKNPELEIVDTTAERCRHLLSKGLYINAGLPPGEEIAGDGNFWCAHTQTIYGPDKKLCDKEPCCDPTRGCYESS